MKLNNNNKMIKTLKDFNRDRKFTLKIIGADSLIRLKKYEGTFTGVGAGIDGNGHPVTGLTEDYQTTNSKGAKVNHKGTRKQMEELLDLASGTLKNTSAYWVTYTVRVGSEDVVLDLRDDYDLLKYLFCAAQSIVAPSLAEVDNNSKAEFVMYSDEEEATAKVVAKSKLRQAYILTDKLTLEQKVQICMVLGHQVDATEINTIENKILEAAEANPAKFLEIANDDRLVYGALVSRALDVGILELKGGGVVHGDIPLGHDRPSAALAISKDKKLETIIKAKLSGDMEVIRKSIVEETKG